MRVTPVTSDLRRYSWKTARARFNDDRGIVPNITESLPRYVGATRRDNNNFIPCYYYRINRVYLYTVTSADDA